MHPLLLSGFDVKVRVQRTKTRGELEVVNGRDGSKPHEAARFRPRQFPHSSIICDAKSGYFSIGALKRLSKEGVAIFLTKENGEILYSLMPSMAVKPDVRIAQVHASENPEMAFRIAKGIVQAKIQRSLGTLDWLGERYDIAKETRLARHEASKLPEASTVAEVRTVEGRTALRYWEAYRDAVPENLEFETRMSSKRGQRASNSSDPVNSALNYSYGVLEGEVRRAVNASGLEAGIGFLHTTADYQSKESLTFDLMEIWRWICDCTVFDAFESRVLDWSSFFFTADDLKMRFTLEAKEKFIGLLRERFNVGTVYRNQRMRWETVIAEKCSEFTRFLVGKAKGLDFTEPSPTLERFDGRRLRSKILSLNFSQAKQVGIPKQSLHDLRVKARSPQPFKLHNETIRKLQAV
jgi:CRISPR-associated protein Cas1